ncbi:hypothetical protein H6P81_003365 [Aristolochia fimbriata]|uniref:Uncharacterized protein n=1 Tax=Aristolochia fimbriata TaxID=158543 RepID=A0AAV7FCC7_ARIFI|nr:hypothetical protein H6P81_003365 [Aristolochia fimbriata]
MVMDIHRTRSLSRLYPSRLSRVPPSRLSRLPPPDSLLPTATSTRDFPCKINSTQWTGAREEWTPNQNFGHIDPNNHDKLLRPVCLPITDDRKTYQGGRGRSTRKPS